MKSLVKWCVALVAISGLVFFSGAWTAQDSTKKPVTPPVPQDSTKKPVTPPVPQQGKPPQPSSEVAKAKAERMDALKKALPALKLPLSEAIAIAERDMHGKAHGADIELVKDGKLQIEVRLLVGDRFQKVYVDQETKKVTASPDDDDDDHDHEGHHEGHKDGH